MASTAPSLDLGLPLARPLRAARAASTASRGSDLPLRATLLAIRSVDLDDVDTHPLVGGGPGPIHTSPCPRRRLLVTSTEGLEPRHQRFVAGGIGLEALGAEQPTERVEGGSDMDVEVRIDATSHTAAQLLRWSWSSLLLGVRDGTAVPDRSDGRSGSCCCNPGQSPQLGDGTCRCQCAAGWSRSTTSRNVTGLQVRPDRSPEVIQDQQSSGGPSEKYQCTGTRRSNDSESYGAALAHDPEHRQAIEKRPSRAARVDGR